MAKCKDTKKKCEYADRWGRCTLPSSAGWDIRCPDYTTKAYTTKDIPISCPRCPEVFYISRKQADNNKHFFCTHCRSFVGGTIGIVKSGKHKGAYEGFPYSFTTFIKKM